MTSWLTQAFANIFQLFTLFCYFPTLLFIYCRLVPKAITKQQNMVREVLITYSKWPFAYKQRKIDNSMENLLRCIWKMLENKNAS